MKKVKYTFAALAALALGLPVSAAQYWLAVGIPNDAGRNVNSGLGNYLVLSDDDPTVMDFNPVKIFDIRRTENGGTKLLKVGNQNATPPYEGCGNGAAHYDLTLPIRDDSGNEFTFVGIANEGFRGNNFVGSIKLPDSMEYINYAAFWQCRYLTDFQWPSDMSKLTIGDRLFDTCSRLVGPMEWPAKFTNLGSRSFADCTSLVGFGGLSVTNVGDYAFSNCPALQTVEFGVGESVTFGNEVFRGDSKVTTVLFYDTPPAINQYILAFNSNGNGIGNTVLDWWGSAGATMYIPLDETQDGATAAWRAFADAFVAAKDGNAVIFPTRGEDGAWSTGSIYNAQVKKTVKLKFWNPDDKTPSALLAY